MALLDEVCNLIGGDVTQEADFEVSNAQVILGLLFASYLQIKM